MTEILKRTDGRYISPTISPQMTVTRIKATIQLDKLVFSCISSVEDNFDSLARICGHEESEILFNNTKLKKRIDPSGRYRYSYQVFHNEIEMGYIDFDLYGGFPSRDKTIRFTIINKVFYTGTLKNIPTVLEDLNLEIKHFSKIDIAIDSYNTDFERLISRNIRCKTNTIKIVGKIEKDKNATLEKITYWNQGSQNNPYKSRAVSIKPKKKDTFELCSYNKKEELNISKKDYILDYHRKFNPKLNKLFRLEIRLRKKEIYEYAKKHRLNLSDLMNTNYLHCLALKYLDRLIVCYNGKNKKKNKILIIPADLQYYNANAI